MTEHVHEWSIASRNGHEAKFRCKFWDCAETLAPEQVKARLNATERLKDQSRLWRHHEDCEPLSQEGCICGLWDARSGYADILEGKDE